MKNNSQIKSKKIIFAAILLLFLLFSNGRFTLFFATWISTTMMLYAVRTLSLSQGFIFSWLIITFSYTIQFYKVVPLPFPFYILTMSLYGIIASLPYVIDKVFSKNKSSFLQTLVFPTSWVVIEYTFLRLNPYGSWTHIAYTQESQQLLLQIIAVFGLATITFLIGWFASVLNWAYQQKFNWIKVQKGVIIYTIIFSLTLFYGSYRTLFQKPISKTIRIASISAMDSLGIYDNDFYGLALEGGKEKFKKQAFDLNENLFNKSCKEAKAGAKMIFWAEGNSMILKEDEEKLYKKASVMAKENKIYLGIAIGIIDQKKIKYLENKFVLFDPKGTIVINYWKANPVPGFEATISTTKEYKIQKTTTSYGTLGTAICFDLDFPHFIQQAKGIDIFLAPSNDWKAIDPIHTNMARFRAIEQGCNLIRQTSNGLSVGVDYTGKIISQMDHFTNNEKVLITQLPTKGITTIYSSIGDLFIVICVLLFFITIFKLKK